jgi:hypothetical protein
MPMPFGTDPGLCQCVPLGLSVRVMARSQEAGQGDWSWPFSLSDGPLVALASSGLPVAAAVTLHLVLGTAIWAQGLGGGLPAICLFGAGCFRKAAGRPQSWGCGRRPWRPILWPGQPVRPHAAMRRPGPSVPCPNSPCTCPGSRSQEALLSYLPRQTVTWTPRSHTLLVSVVSLGFRAHTSLESVLP